jgi:hypothetical protein
MLVIVQFLLLILISVIGGYTVFCDSLPITNQPEIYRNPLGKLILWFIVVLHLPLLIWIWLSNGFKYALLGFILAGIIVGITRKFRW